MPGETYIKGNKNSFEAKYEGLKNEVGFFMNANLPAFDVKGQKTLGEAMRYSVSAGGKRIRGVLAMAVYELLDEGLRREPGSAPNPCRQPAGQSGFEPREAVLTLAGAIEFIHAYSLIHDDMPCMDDDDFRRGKPSCHKVYGEGMAMLAGDSLLNLAFEILLQYPAPAAARAKTACPRFAEAALYIARASGARGMAGGQAMDLCVAAGDGDNEDKNFAGEGYLDSLHRLKTGKLFDAAIISPAICLDAGEEDYKALCVYGAAVGIAFQIKDDLLDIADLKTMDEKRNYAAVFGVPRAEQKLQNACSDAINSLGRFSSQADFLRDVASFIARRAG